MERLFQRSQGKERGDDAYGPDRERAAFETEVAAEILEQQGDGDHHAAHEIGHRRGDRRAQVRAELLGGNGHEDGPVAAGKSEHEAHTVEEARAPAPLQEVQADGAKRQEHEQENGLFPALQGLA